MLKKDVIQHYGSGAAAARALGLQRAAVQKWPDLVPAGWAAQLHFLTRGKLRYDLDDYAEPDSRERQSRSLSA
jgi:hypothetical protein